MLRIRNSVPAETIEKMSNGIQERTIGLGEFSRATVIGAYCPVGSEARTNAILKKVLESNKKLVLPRVSDATSIFFAGVKDLEKDVEIGTFNIMEPKDHCERVDKIDLVLVPGIAWDEQGHRIGYGQGYYDRYLAKLRTTSVGLAFDFQVFEVIPHGINDFCVSMIVTEKRIIRTRR
jgi:5-formyltetrahydrofolate cyclo-ligase